MQALRYQTSHFAHCNVSVRLEIVIKIWYATQKLPGIHVPTFPRNLILSRWGLSKSCLRIISGQQGTAVGQQSLSWRPHYTGWFRKDQCFRNWQYRELREKRKFIWTCVYFWMVIDIELFECQDVTSLDFFWFDWMKNEAYKRKVNTGGELSALDFESHNLHKETWILTQANNTRSSHAGTNYLQAY